MALRTQHQHTRAKHGASQHTRNVPTRSTNAQFSGSLNPARRENNGTSAQNTWPVAMSLSGMMDDLR